MSNPKVRSPIMVILFTILTCGIYLFYWMYATTKEIRDSLQNPGTSVSKPFMVIVLSILTCGIYDLYWFYMQVKRIAQLQGERGLPVKDNAVLILILMIVFSPAALYIMQSDLNAIAASNPPQA